MDNLFVRAWKGQASLAAAFWVIYFVCCIVLYIIIFYILNAINPMLKNSPAMGNLISAIVFPYIFYAAICVWRCGKNSNAFWRILSRIIIVLVVAGTIYNIVMLFIPHG